MADKQLVGKPMNDLADEWHWIVLHDAQEFEPGRFLATSVDTVCGIYIKGWGTVRLFDTGAPDEPTCEACREGGVGDGLFESIAGMLRGAREREPELTPA